MQNQNPVFGARGCDGDDDDGRWWHAKLFANTQDMVRQDDRMGNGMAMRGKGCGQKCAHKLGRKKRMLPWYIKISFR